MTFSREPILWIGAIIAIAMTVRDIINNELTIQSLDAVIVALGAVLGRKLVSPVDER